MKKIYLTLVFSLTALMINAQCLVTASGTNILCNGQCNGTATASGVGVPPLNYLWSPGGQTTATISGLCAGTYTVAMVDGSSCTSSSTVTITEPGIINATSTTTNITCNGLCNGSATAFASGGTGSFTHKWNTIPTQTSATATALCVGLYYDTIKDANGCQKILGPVSISQPAPLMAIVTCSSVSCFGGSDGSATATQTGGTSSYTYSWNTIPAQTTASISGLTPGTYVATITDANGCTASSGCTVNQPSAALAVSATGTNASCATCCDGSVTATATAGTAGYTYLWSPGGQTTATVTAVCAGNYTVCVTDANGCTACAPVSVNFTTGLNDITALYEITLFPNPASDFFELQMNLPSSTNILFKLYDLIGNEVYTESVTANGGYKKKFSMQTYPPGVYFLQTGVDGSSATKKLIKY